MVHGRGRTSCSQEGRGSEATATLWSPEDVRVRLEEAGRTLMSLPMPNGALPKDVRSNWPDVVRGYEDAFAALIGASEEVRRDFADRHNRVRVSPSAQAVGRMDEALDWLWRVEDPRKRRLCLSRALIHPISGRHVASFRKLGRIFGLHHETVRAWHDRALAQIATALTQQEVSKDRRPVRPRGCSRRLS
jgi:hypothetical protein